MNKNTLGYSVADRHHLDGKGLAPLNLMKIQCVKELESKMIFTTDPFTIAKNMASDVSRWSPVVIKDYGY